MLKPFLICLGIIVIASCKKGDSNEDFKVPECPHSNIIESGDMREFKMGFSTWPYGPEIFDVDSTYNFIKRNGDIYSEHLDDKIPWNSWINGTALPEEFINSISYKASKRTNDIELLLSVSLLNISRNELMVDFDGNFPEYENLNDQHIEDAYFNHLSYLIDALDPNYLVLAIEANQLLIHSELKWGEYKLLMANIRLRIKQTYPDLPISESMTLHDWQLVEPSYPAGYTQEIADYISNLDFAAISFYPFLEGFQSKTEFQGAFDFLHENVSIPIAFVETGNISEDLILTGLNYSIVGSRCAQQAYLEVLLLNSQQNAYLFDIWWTFADYDALWAIFPAESQELGSIWLNTGLINETGEAKPAYQLWQESFSN